MPEPHDQSAPTPGEAQNTPAPGGTPNAPGSEAVPTNGTPTLDIKAIRQEGFGDGYGKGIDKGARTESQRWGEVLGEYGLPTSIDELREALESRQSPPEGNQPPASVEESEQYKKLARDHIKATKAQKDLEARLAAAEKRADQARLDRFARAAMARGVGKEQLDYFLRAHQERVRMTEDGKLVVLTQMDDGTLVDAGESVDDYIDGIVEAAPFLCGSNAPKGAGSQVTSVDRQRKPPGDIPVGWDPTPAHERLGVNKR